MTIVDPAFLKGVGTIVVGVSLVLREALSFLVKWKAARNPKTKEYKPEPEWMMECRGEFRAIRTENADIYRELSDMKTTQEIMRVQVSHLEMAQKKTNNKKNGGYPCQ